VALTKSIFQTSVCSRRIYWARTAASKNSGKLYYCWWTLQNFKRNVD